MTADIIGEVVAEPGMTGFRSLNLECDRELPRIVDFIFDPNADKNELCLVVFFGDDLPIELVEEAEGLVLTAIKLESARDLDGVDPIWRGLG